MHKLLMAVTATILAGGLLTSSAEAETAKTEDPCATYITGDQPTNAADPTVFAKDLLRALTRFERAIPLLSPDEERWLENELMAGDQQRALQRLRSREYALSRALPYAQTLATSMRNIVTERERPELIKKWLVFVDELFAWGDDEFLAIALEKHAIDPKALPVGWSSLKLIFPEVLPDYDNMTILEGIDRGQRGLVRDIVHCTLPALGVGSRADAAPR
jgi:hypothetical protein